LGNLNDEDIKKPSSSLKNLTKHMKDITTKSMFKDQRLVDRWKIISCDENVEMFATARKISRI
jgi:hypothetical protein